MGDLNVQFSDASKELIVGYYGSAQDPELYENMGVVESDDPRWKTYYEAFPDNMKPYLPAPTK